MVELTIDGNTVEVPAGSMVMHAAQKIGLYVPHFCYHKKLSIAANCRMCLVEVEKAPKALPACATPATNGMIVHTCSERARAAQKSVMEFLLINHPLDCPICDQGGECQLQDLAVGYGGSASRYSEEKRVVFHKDVGPLVSAEEMSRCIHCTRCVRFGQEIAGVMELGMLGRGEHAEITTFVGRTIESELSGNMIDLCPVGALTSKPFRYSARAWELARRRSVSPHDSLGANLVVQVKDDRVMRVVPFEDESVNECWISDRDRFSYEGLNSDDRLQTPMIRSEQGVWQEATWQDALQAVSQGLSRVRDSFGGGQIGALASETATTEEFALLARLTRALGSENVDFRLRQTDDAWDAGRTGTPWLGMPIADLDTLDRVLVVGSVLRKDHPLMAQRLRQATKNGTQLNLIEALAVDPLMAVNGRILTAPSRWAQALGEVAHALAQAKGRPVADAFSGLTPGAEAILIADSLAGGANVAVFLGNLAVNAADAALIAANAQAIAELADGKFGVLTSGGNTLGGYLAGATPGEGGKNARAMLSESLKAYVVLHAEPLLDAADGERAVASLRGAQFSVALTAYRSAAADWANVMLPIAPFTETSGTFVNTEGRAQSFKGVVAPLGQSRPGWKVLRVLGNLLQLPNFDDETSETLRDGVLNGGFDGRLSNRFDAAPALPAATAAVDGLERLADLPIYRTDAIVRRAEPLQDVRLTPAPKVGVNAATLARLGVDAGAKVRLVADQAQGEFLVVREDAVADGVLRLSAGFAETAVFGAGVKQLVVERV